MSQFFIRITLVALLAITVESFGNSTAKLVDSASGTEVYLDAVTPPFLYHWTKFSHLAQIAHNKKRGDHFTRFSGGIRHAAVSIYWPSLVELESGVLFTWTHPVTGMKGGPSENYGSALVKLKIDTVNSRTLRIVEKWNQKTPPSESRFPNLDLSKFDIIIREAKGLKEVMLLNPKVILGFTADPNLLRPELSRELKNLKDSNFEYAESDIHLDRFADHDPNRKEFRDYAMANIADLLETGREFVPAFFLIDLDGRPTASWEDLQETKRRIEIKEFPLRIPQMKFDAQFRLRYNEYLGNDLAKEILWNVYETKGRKGPFEKLFATLEDYHFQDLANKIKPAEAMALREKIFNSPVPDQMNFDLALDFIQRVASQMRTADSSGAISCRSTVVK